MSNTYAGSCLCGEARFEILGEFERFYLCHCEFCRKDTGSAHAANLFSSTAVLKWVAGEDKTRQFNLPGTRHSKCFCSKCRAALPMMHDRRQATPAQNPPRTQVDQQSRESAKLDDGCDLNDDLNMAPDEFVSE